MLIGLILKKIYEEHVTEKLNRRNARKILNGIDWTKWVTEKGFPTYKMEFKSKYTGEVEDLIQQFLDNKENPEDALKLFKNWHTNVKLTFLDEIKKNIKDFDDNLILKIKDELNLVEDYNDDVKAIWYEITLQKGLNDEIDNIKNFLQTHGRLKYLKPLYYGWIKINLEEARKFFDENKYLYHPIARRLIQNKFDSEK